MHIFKFPTDALLLLFLLHLRAIICGIIWVSNLPKAKITHCFVTFLGLTSLAFFQKL